MLGTPIQIDHATATQSRLSFARICVEIDISKPQTEEFIIDMMGREVVQKVVWDKIPLYCRECHHVGHSSSTCYANGKREKPVKRNYHRPTFGNARESQPQYYKNTMAGNTEQEKMATQQKEMEATEIAHQQDMGRKDRREGNNVVQQEQTRANQGVKGWGYVDKEGFRKQGKRRGPRHNNHNASDGALPRTNSTGDMQRGRRPGEQKSNETGILDISTTTYHNHGVELRRILGGWMKQGNPL